MRLIVEIDRTPDGRIEGRVRPDASQPWRPFSGVLELLKVLEDLLDGIHGCLLVYQVRIQEEGWWL